MQSTAFAPNPANCYHFFQISHILLKGHPYVGIVIEISKVRVDHPEHHKWVQAYIEFETFGQMIEKLVRFAH